MPESKIIFFGKANAGKSMLCQRILQPELGFNPPALTIGVEFCRRQYDKFVIKAWDIGGNERYKSFRNAYYRDITIGIYCVNLDPSESIDTQEIARDIEEFRQVNKEATLILVGTKADKCTDINAAQRKLGEIKADAFSERMITSCIKASNNEYDALPELLEQLIVSLSKQKLGIVEKPVEIDIPPTDPLIAARNKLSPQSPLYNALDNLSKITTHLESNKYQAIGRAANTLVNALGKENITKAIEAFTNDCHEILEGKHPIIMKAVFSVAVTALVTSLALTFGSSFIVGCSLGLITSALTTYSLFKPSPVVAAIDTIADEAKCYQPQTMV